MARQKIDHLSDDFYKQQVLPHLRRKNERYDLVKKYNAFGADIIPDEEIYPKEFIDYRRQVMSDNIEKQRLEKRFSVSDKRKQEVESFREVWDYYYNAPDNQFEDIADAINREARRDLEIERRKEMLQSGNFDWLIANYHGGLIDIGNMAEMSLLKRLEVEVYSTFLNGEEDMNDDLRVAPTNFLMEVENRRSFINDIINGKI